MPDFGDKVDITAIFVRRHTRKPTTEGHTEPWKIWVSKPYEAKGCIFLGTRTLKNGVRDFEDECGYFLRPKEHFEAALVCPGPRKAPILVPMDCIGA